MILENQKEEEKLGDSDWQTPIYKYFEMGDLPRDRLLANKIKSKENNYELQEGVLYQRSFLDPLLRCLSREEGVEILKTIHYGDAGNYSGTRSLAKKTKGWGYFWPHMHENAKDFTIRC